jgi:PTH1 family peptidyl-tRNA hydrolase
LSQDAPPSIIAGLGNPGSEYAATRHNIGFMVVDEIARRFGTVTWRKKHGASYTLVSDGRLVLVKPMEFMNDSGPPLQGVARFYRVPQERMLVISDDLDLPFGKLRIRPHGGHGGHNGLRSIIAHGGSLFPRLRIGIGRRAGSSDHAVITQVLGNFDAAEQTALPSIVEAAAESALLWLEKGIDPAMRFSNTWQAKDPLNEGS